MNILENDVKDLNKYNTYVNKEELIKYLEDDFLLVLPEIFNMYPNSHKDLKKVLENDVVYFITQANQLSYVDKHIAEDDMIKKIHCRYQVTPAEWLGLIGIEHSKPTKKYEIDKINIEDIHYICEFDYTDCQKPVLTVREALWSDDDGKKKIWITLTGNSEDGPDYQQICLSITGLKALSSDLMKLALQLEKEGD
jgi:hypothetical protein